ncbi:hypothetical protein [Nonomuraea dietziae]|uniref:Uncharacterized protein n=1 Tax=Nonomuraea dietziae TaxID=65515 RepID=A0A7W5Y7L4_9ACTN|nr:hypothetical protein [Nonomuraea dietziae]MBB3727473.1 hypothetical protein [Nonomuraea dietziae]
MKKLRKTLALTALSLVSGTVLVASPAHAEPAGTAGCPTPTKAEARRSADGKEDRPAKGVTALKGVRVGHLPKGFLAGQVVVNKLRGAVEYGYQWYDDRDEIDRKHRSLWVRVVCWPAAGKLSHLKKAPLDLGTFSGDDKTARIGGRTVLTKEGDGALGHGRYVGWVEREGVIVTVMASEPLVPELDEIVKGIRL